MKHSPLPWKQDGISILDAKNKEVAETWGGQNPKLCLADAELIVQSVNNYASLEASHKELVEALGRAIAEMKFWAKGHADTEIEIAEEALANESKLTK